MKKIYKIEVDCANCANLIEDAVRKMTGVAAATVNFMTQKMTIEFQEGYMPEDIMTAVVKTGRKIELDFEIEFD